jgi:succinate-semialdehyde dehydrogenase/glutarate-semialdehyde dehydrogenase
MAFQSINPATEALLGEFPEHGAEQIEAALGAADAAFQKWRRTSFAERAVLLKSAARQILARKAHYASLITDEMGKPIVEAEAEIEKCAWGCDYYAENAEAILASQQRDSSATESYVSFEPIGAVLAVMPWNFPFWQVFRFAAPALMAGNVGILKHAANVPQCALAIEEIFRAAGFPDGVFQTLLIGSDHVAGLIEDDRVKAVTLTGSEFAGSRVAEKSGQVIKKTVLELGGSDPFIVLADADLDAAAKTAVNARYQNTGQSCIAAKRFIVEDSVYDPFLERFLAAVEQLQVGDPHNRGTNLGPLARDDLRTGVDNQVQRSLDLGAALLAGGNRIDGKGFFYAPTVLGEVQPGMPAFDEETFGPVAAFTRCQNTEEAISLANRSRYGLGAALWTRDLANARRLAAEIESGMVFVNGMVASEPGLPFGGIKKSGYGRELADFGIREFVNIKTVWIGPRRGPAPNRASE